MVKILASGEIVQDDDPRARTTKRTERGRGSGRRRQGFIQGDEHREQEVEQMQGDGLHGQQVAREGDGPNTVATIIDGFNNRLITMGFPRFNIGPYTVEPIVAVGTILAGLLLGLPGLLFAALLFAIVKWSQSDGSMASFLSGRGESNSQRPPGSRSNERRGPPGRGRRTPRGGGQSGQRLGRS